MPLFGKILTVGVIWKPLAPNVQYKWPYKARNLPADQRYWLDEITIQKECCFGPCISTSITRKIYKYMDF